MFLQIATTFSETTMQLLPKVSLAATCRVLVTVLNTVVLVTDLMYINLDTRESQALQRPPVLRQ